LGKLDPQTNYNTGGNMRLYFELSPREIENGRQLQPIIAIPIISRGEPNTEPVPWEEVCQGNLQLGTSMDEGCLERSERSPTLIALAYESGLGEKGSLGFGMLGDG
jgi:hypothetical protein